MLIGTITNKMKTKKLHRRNTSQRRIILEELRKVKTHPTADLIFKMARRRISDISFGTVYRNLSFLQDEGQIIKLSLGRRACRYDGNPKAHYHFYCLTCAGVFDLDKGILYRLDKLIKKQSGFEVKYHRMAFYGYCRKC